MSNAPYCVWVSVELLDAVDEQREDPPEKELEQEQYDANLNQCMKWFTPSIDSDGELLDSGALQW